MAAEVIGYEFRFDQPTDTGNGMVDVPTVFSLSGISQDVAKGIRQGLRNVPSIKNVVAVQVTQDRGTLAT